MDVSSPTLSTAWRDLLARLSKTSGVALDIIDPASLDEEALLLSRLVSLSSDRVETFLERQHEAEAAGYPRLA